VEYRQFKNEASEKMTNDMQSVKKITSVEELEPTKIVSLTVFWHGMKHYGT
jgi:hypothetical protein